ncbi:MAG: DUF6671 family protein [Pseudomonadota bacterium]
MRDPVSDKPLLRRRAAIATMHGKEAAIAPVLERRPGLRLIVPEHIDTDSLGTFTGDTPRRGTVLETAIAKAHLGMSQAGVTAGIANEGTYGAHPVLPIAPGGSELIVYVDDELGVQVHEAMIVEKTNFAHLNVTPGEDVTAFLASIGFPAHGVVVSPHAPQSTDAIYVKGIRDHATLDDAIAKAANHSADNAVLIQTDMRAHMNPTRMDAIAMLTEKLAARLESPCPNCAAPGFGQVDRKTGLPCRDCGGPSTLVRVEVHGCGACDCRQEVARQDGLRVSDPTYCLICNP